MYKTFCDNCGKDLDTKKVKKGEIERVYQHPGEHVTLYKNGLSYYVELEGIWCSVKCFLAFAKRKLK